MFRPSVRDRSPCFETEITDNVIGQTVVLLLVVPRLEDLIEHFLAAMPEL